MKPSPSHDKLSRDQVAEATVRYLDHDLEGDDLARLGAALRDDPESLRMFDEISGQAFALSEPGEAALTAERPSRVVEKKSSPFRVTPASVAGFGLAAALAILLVVRSSPESVPTPPPAPVPELATVSVTGGAARILLPGDDELSRRIGPDESAPLHEGDRLRMFHPEATAEVVYADGSELTFNGWTEAVFEMSPQGGKRVQVISGQVSADITRQPEGMPVVLDTPTSTIEVLGTTLQVAASDSRTRLAVNSGRVALIRHADGSRVEVGAGKQADTGRDSDEPLSVGDLPPLPDEWILDFQSGLLDGWQCGKWIPEEDAVLAHPNLENGFNYYSISAPNAWGQGHHSHFQVFSDSVLYLTYKMERPDDFMLMLNLRATPDSVRKHGGNAFYEKRDWHENLEADAWRTARIPLSDFNKFGKRKYRTNEADLSGLGVYQIYLTTQRRDRGLHVKEIRLTREPVEAKNSP